MKVALYARVSKAIDQTNENQLLELNRWAASAGHQIIGTWCDEASSKDTRPQKEEVKRLARLGEVEGIAFVALDRWGRTMSELVLDIEEFNRRGVALISLKEGFNFDSASGRLYGNMLAAFANFERDRIRERTLAGLARAKANGLRGGRHPVDCGCGRAGHNGSIKPIRDGSNRWTGWDKTGGANAPLPAVESPDLK